MTPAQIISEVRTFGGNLILIGERIRVEPGPVGIPRRLIDEVREHKPAIIVEMRQHEAMIEAARLLRIGQWPPVAKVCDFHIGQSGTTCRRCGASWLEHYPAPADGAAP
ncbi:MAG: hypothetical protein ACYCX6_00105 [Vulcanimicrobiaceae bacterium]